MSAPGQNAKYSPRVDVFCFASINRHPAVGPAGPFGAMNRLMHRSKEQLFNHLIGTHEERRRDCEAKRFGSPHVNSEVEMRGTLER
jgi:hypothetical protein